MSSWLCPYYISNLRISSENSLERRSGAGELRGRVNLFEKLLHHRSARVRKTQKLIVVSILVSTTKGESESFVTHRDIPSPILRNHLLRRDAPIRKLLD